MKMTKMFGRTLREKPAEAELVSHELMLRAALVSRLAAGIYSYLPMAWISTKKIKDILQDEMNAIGGQEINMPVVNPADYWQETGRWYSVGPELARFKDRAGHHMCLAMTHEETVTDLARKFIDSYRQLPMVLYHIQTKFRDEPRSRGGLIRVREFTMKDAYSFHTDAEDLERYYPLMCKAYKNICQRCGVPVSMVLSDVGMMGGTAAHEFMYITDVGEDTVIICQECGYAANREVATILKSPGVGDRTKAGPVKKVPTPNRDTIALVSEFLNVEPRETLKTMVYSVEDEMVLVVIRGDLDVNERKLANVLRVSEVKAATSEEIDNKGLVQGYMSPVGVENLRVIADDSVLSGVPYVAGANQKGYHLKNVVPGRDFAAGERCDVALAREKDPCPVCGKPLTISRGIEIGNTFMLGTRYSKPMGATYRSEDGKDIPVVMGCYGMGVGRLLACVIEANHDDKGIIWPMTVAPYQVHMVELGTSPAVKDTAGSIYQALTDQGFEVLYDDRKESAGVKFNDADLLGMPIRITVSQRNFDKGCVELKMRNRDEVRNIPVEDLSEEIRRVVAEEQRRFIPDGDNK